MTKTCFLKILVLLLSAAMAFGEEGRAEPVRSDDPLPVLADVRKRIPEIFKWQNSRFQCQRLEKRLESAERLAALPKRTLLMQAELDEFRRYFKRAFELWAVDPSNPKVTPVEFNAKDFGALGDGKTDDMAAFARAVGAVRALGGKPSVLRVPGGTYFLASSRPTASGNRANLDFSCLTNCLVEGENPEFVRFEFGDYEANGVCLDRSVNTTLANADFSWREAPFAQTVLESYDAATASAVVKHYLGTLKPDDPRYRKADHAQVCGLFAADGAKLLDRGATVFFDLKADDLGGGRYRIYFDSKRPGMKNFRPRTGDVVILPDRSNRILGATMWGAEFCNFSRVWFRNARSVTINTWGAFYATADHCRTFPKSRDLVFSSNADTFYSGRGSYLAHCEFNNMNDDGANSSGHGTPVLERRDARTLVIRMFRFGGGRLAAGDVVQLVRAVEGRFLGTWRAASVTAFKADNGEDRRLVTFDGDLPSDLTTVAEVGAMAEATRYAISHGTGKVAKAADLFYAPLAFGTGFTAWDNTIHDLRGCGINVQCPNSIIEGNMIENVSLGMQMTGLTQWFEGPPPYNVLIRGNVFRNCQLGVQSVFKDVNGAVSKERPITYVEITGNRFENVACPLRLHNTEGEIITDNTVIPEKK